MKKRTSQEILAETLLELSRNTPVDKITLKQIIQESGLSTKTFYNHFRDKYALMAYIIDAETEKMHAKLKLGEYSYHDYILDGVSYYQRMRGFLQNVFRHTSGEESIRKKHAEATCRALAGYLQKRNEISEIPEDILLSLRLYAYGLDELFSFCYLHGDRIEPEAFVREAEESMPEKLKPYFI